MIVPFSNVEKDGFMASKGVPFNITTISIGKALFSIPDHSAVNSPIAFGYLIILVANIPCSQLPIKGFSHYMVANYVLQVIQ